MPGLSDTNTQTSGPSTVGTQVQVIDGMTVSTSDYGVLKGTYRSGAVANTFYSTAAAVILEIKGSSSKTVRIKSITIWAQTATKAYTELTLMRCTGTSGGSPTAATIGKHDLSDGNPTAVINYYTGSAGLGAGATVIGARVLSTVVPSTTVAAFTVSWDFTQHNEKALVLRGNSDVIEIYNNLTGLGTGTFGFEICWDEDNS